jgi:hypothetical protein
MSGGEVDLTEYVPMDRWRRTGRIGAIRRRVRRVAVGAGIVFLGLTLAPPGRDGSLLVGMVRLLSLVTGVSAWSVGRALEEAAGDGGDGSVLAAVGSLVLVTLAWSADRSRTGALLWRLLVGEVVASATETDAVGASTAPDDPTGSAAVTESDGNVASRPSGSYLGILATLLVGGAVVLSYLSRAGTDGIDPGQIGVFLLLTAAVGGVVGLLAALSLG